MSVLTEVASRCNSLCEASFCSVLLFIPCSLILLVLSVLESLLGLRGFHPLLCLFSLLCFSSLPERKPGLYSLFSFSFPFPYFFCFTFFHDSPFAFYFLTHFCLFLFFLSFFLFLFLYFSVRGQSWPNG